eukprot:TRINITY_DN36427_c0_g1_i1.p1 TRINITY_DN36427_c0_g1~~TRINITY_DN36427_c0_g1_i1.p1  ORF type:complete len:167 (+),score=15.91 TRINITY_DN36427_c0_g1_i1:306-806(+)
MASGSRNAGKLYSFVRTVKGNPDSAMKVPQLSNQETKSNAGKAVKIFSYDRTLKSNSEYATKMTRLSNQIFGEVRRPTSENSMRIVKRLSRAPYEEMEVHNRYYPAIEETTELMNILREYGLYRDEHADFKEEMTRLRAMRGKARIRPKWKDGVKPTKTVEFRYDD